MTESNFYTDPEALEASRDDNLPPSLLGNPLFDDEPTPLSTEDDEPEREPRRAARPARPEPQEEPADEPEPVEPQAPQHEPQRPPQPSPVHLDPNALAQAIVTAQRAMTPRPQSKIEDFDPPEIDVDEEAILEGRASLKKALRDAQISTARAVREQIYGSLQEPLEALQGYSQYIQSRLPVDEWNAKTAARSELLRQGYVEEGDVDDLMEAAAPMLASDWNHRVNPRSWMAAVQYAAMERNRGNLPVRQKAKPSPGAGKGDVTPARKSNDPLSKNRHLGTVEKLLGRPINRERAKDFLEARHGR